MTKRKRQPYSCIQVTGVRQQHISSAILLHLHSSNILVYFMSPEAPRWRVISCIEGTVYTVVSLYPYPASLDISLIVKNIQCIHIALRVCIAIVLAIHYTHYTVYLCTCEPFIFFYDRIILIYDNIHFDISRTPRLGVLSAAHVFLVVRLSFSFAAFL